MIDAFVFLAPLFLLAVVFLLGLTGCLSKPTPQAPPPPSITPPLNPVWGYSAGGASVTIYGANFANGDTVTFGGVSANVSSLSDAVIVATTPAHSPGAVDVVVTNTGGESGTAPQAFTYGITEAGTALDSKPSTAQLKLNPVQGQLIVLVVVWAGPGTLSVNAPGAVFTLIKQADLGPNNPPNQPVHVAVYFANNVGSAIAITGTLTGGSGPQLSMVATAYNSVDPNLSLAGQFNSQQGAGTNIALPLSIPGLAPGDLIYAVVATLNAVGDLGGTMTPPMDSTVVTRTQSPIPSYLLVDDHVVLPQDTGGPYNIMVTGGGSAISWYAFGMRIKAGA